MMKKRLFTAFGPLLCAVLLIGGLFLGPWKINSHDPKVIAQAATAMNDAVFRGDRIKNEAIKTGEYVPFFGSSELNRVSATHPSVLAQKYQRSYTPFLIGAPGTQSLTQYGIIHSMAKELGGKKAVFVVSPQWFVPKGLKEDYFNHHYSEQHVYDWLASLKKVSEADQYYAQRLLDFAKVRENDLTEQVLNEVKSGKVPTDWQKKQIDLQRNILKREDELFSGFSIGHNLNAKIAAAAKKLPSTYDLPQIEQVADNEGKAETDNNFLGIKNSFYRKNLASRLEKMKDSQKKWDYRFGPEYSDFQLVLNEFARNNVDVLFVIPPINQKWMDYTGLPKQVLTGFVQKIRYQLKSQGFTNIADLSAKGDQPYFMEDTIHLGWCGWLAADKFIQPFLDPARKEKPLYDINNYFLSEKWQQETPEIQGK
ncbi:D-alanyl-lipoteichoic acid biosynthesis protein DltD [Enterococcus sp.]|uniref:D-alanyl-lipoteichoic acid biosynthesis protein DltD n=1 Tax=Enterococcus sp. TaxID=35783 RepID=UPI0025BE4B53|nr:D-alanyl-lipoteichoic acid biosynthesis protein DltD [Enterococcus sp.]